MATMAPVRWTAEPRVDGIIASTSAASASCVVGTLAKTRLESRRFSRPRRSSSTSRAKRTANCASFTRIGTTTRSFSPTRCSSCGRPRREWKGGSCPAGRGRGRGGHPPLPPPPLRVTVIGDPPPHPPLGDRPKRHLGAIDCHQRSARRGNIPLFPLFPRTPPSPI